MANTVTPTRTGVVNTEAAANATMHGPHDRSTVKGVVVAEAQANAILNTATASE